MLFGGKKEVLFPLIVSIFEKGYLYFFLVSCFVGFLGVFFLIARPPEQPSIWEIFPEYVDTISLLSVSVNSCCAGKGKGSAYYSLMVC